MAREALRLAEAKGLESMAFAALSTGAFGYPAEAAARIALGTVLDHAGSLESIRRIRFVLHDAGALAVHQRALEEVGSADG